MKRLLPVFLILFSLSLNAQDMQNYLSDTEEMVSQGNYKKALQRYIWFHEHALEKDKSMSGVRLSFALSDWKALADVYPPAMKALVEIRDAKSKQISTNGGTSDLFKDVRAINRTIGENAKTIALFDTLYIKYPNVAKSCWHYAKDDLFEAKRYDIIGKFIGNPMREYSVIVEDYKRDTTYFNTMESGSARTKAYGEDRFVERSIQLIQFAIAVNDLKAAKDIQQEAMKVLEDYRLHDAIPADINK